MLTAVHFTTICFAASVKMLGLKSAVKNTVGSSVMYLTNIIGCSAQRKSGRSLLNADTTSVLRILHVSCARWTQQCSNDSEAGISENVWALSLIHISNRACGIGRLHRRHNYIEKYPILIGSVDPSRLQSFIRESRKILTEEKRQKHRRYAGYHQRYQGIDQTHWWHHSEQRNHDRGKRDHHGHH